MGKSTVIHRIAARLRAEEPNPAFTPVVIVQASPEDVGSSARLDFYRQVLHALCGHVAIRDRIENYVECQNCGARRDMKKVKDRQKFPPHPPRKTPPPKGEERWVVREEEWKLVKD